MTDIERHILIFGGTTEGRQLAEFCEKNKIPAYVSAATEYGGSLIQQTHFVSVIIGRKSADEISAFISGNNITLVLDATHPFATEASRNIASACRSRKIRYIRVLRQRDSGGNGIYFDAIPQVVDYLNEHTEGTVFITTGSKELHLYRGIKNYSERCAARILPAEGALEKCLSLGFREKMIIMQRGPFTEAQNIEHLRQFGAAFLVTKESGAAGGFEAKRSASQKCGAEFLVIRRPDESGILPEEAERIMIQENGENK